MILSASSLSVYRDCPRCFWLQLIEGIKRPKAPFPSLPTSIDVLLKAEADRVRPGLPPGLDAADCQLYPDQEAIDAWRDWQRGLRTRFGSVEVMGCVDDVLWAPQPGAAMVLDFKTCGHRPGDGSKWYRDQLDLYTLLLGRSGLKTVGWGCLLYWWPASVEGERIGFRTEAQWIPVDPDRALELLKAAARCLRGPLPEGGCPWCRYVAAAAG